MSAVQGTFDGRTISHDEMSHQHLSNCVWHFRIWKGASDLSLRHFFATLDRRFNGELLPFRPILQFQAEIDALYKNGMVVPVDEFKSNIIFKGEVIGELFNSFEKKRDAGENDAYNNEIKSIT